VDSSVPRVVARAVDVHKRYGPHEALRGVSLEVRRGEVVCLIGPPGSGKSSLLRCLGGLDPIDSGEIEVSGPIALFDRPAMEFGTIELLAGEGITALVVTEELSFMRAAADRLLMLDEGLVIEEGPPEHFWLDPRDRRTKAFLAKGCTSPMDKSRRGSTTWGSSPESASNSTSGAPSEAAKEKTHEQEGIVANARRRPWPRPARPRSRDDHTSGDHELCAKGDERRVAALRLVRRSGENHQRPRRTSSASPTPRHTASTTSDCSRETEA
jgi:ABC-type multidrug transport system ATPase subunit